MVATLAAMAIVDSQPVSRSERGKVNRPMTWRSTVMIIITTIKWIIVCKLQ